MGGIPASASQPAVWPGLWSKMFCFFEASATVVGCDRRLGSRRDGSTHDVIDHEHIRRCRTRVDARRWLLSTALARGRGGLLDGPDRAARRTRNPRRIDEGNRAAQAHVGEALRPWRETRKASIGRQLQSMFCVSECDSTGIATQSCLVRSQPDKVGAGNLGSAKAPRATPT
jgi:hypothetical protein